MWLYQDKYPEFDMHFQVIIAGLYGTELNQTVSFDRPVKSVGIDPFFSKHGRGRQFVIGEEKVLWKHFFLLLCFGCFFIVVF